MFPSIIFNLATGLISSLFDLCPLAVTHSAWLSEKSFEIDSPKNKASFEDPLYIIYKINSMRGGRSKSQGEATD